MVYDGQSNEVAALVGQQLVEHVQGAMVLWDRARVGSRSAGAARPQRDLAAWSVVRPTRRPDGTGVGDLSLGGDGARVRAARRRLHRRDRACSCFCRPATRKAFSSDGGVRFWPQLLAAGRRDRLTWAARFGVHVRPQNACDCDLSPGTELTAGAGGTWRFVPRFAAGAELYLASAIAGGPFASRAGTSLEVLLAGHVAVAPRWNVSFGVAPGLTDGAGTPAARVVAGVQYVVESVKPPRLPEPPPAMDARRAAEPVLPMTARRDDQRSGVVGGPALRWPWSARAAAPRARWRSATRPARSGDVAIIGNTLGQDCRSQVPGPVVGTVARLRFEHQRSGPRRLLAVERTEQSDGRERQHRDHGRRTRARRRS